MIKLRWITFIPLLLIAGCTQPTPQNELAVKSVKVITVSQSTDPTARSLSGTLVSASTSQLSFRVSGLIDLINVQVGDRVNAGDVVAKLTQREFKLGLDSAQAELNSARADYSEKEEELARQKQLKSQGFVAQAAVDQAQAAYNQAKSSLEVAKADLETAKNDLSYTVLASPVSGSVSQRSFEPFAEVSAGQTVFEIQAGDELEVEVLVPETMINDIDYGDIVAVTVPSVDSQSLTATVSEIGTTSVAGNAYQVSVRLAEPNTSLRSGMTAKVSFQQSTPDGQNTFLIPLTALDTRVGEKPLTLGDQQVSVFVVEDGVTVRRVITVNDLNGNDIQVIDGLSAGDNVIVAGVSFIDEGQSVSIWTPTYNLPAVIEQ